MDLYEKNGNILYILNVLKKYSDEDHPNIRVYQEAIEETDFIKKFTFVELLNKPQTVRYIMTVPEGTIDTTGMYNIDME